LTHEKLIFYSQKAKVDFFLFLHHSSLSFIFNVKFSFAIVKSKKKFSVLGLAVKDKSVVANMKSEKIFFPPNFCRFPGAPSRHLNPGSISNLHKKTRDLTPEWIEGLSLRCAKNLDVHQTIYADWKMGNNTPVGFRLGGMFCRKDNERVTVSFFLFS
jgi:hypothetical protein